LNVGSGYLKSFVAIDGDRRERKYEGKWGLAPEYIKSIHPVIIVSALVQIGLVDNNLRRARKHVTTRPAELTS
jgi:hypothetical protein